MSVLPKLIHRFKTISVKIPAGSYVEIDKLVLKYMWKWKAPRIAKTTLKIKNIVTKLISRHKYTVIKTVLYWYQHRQINGTQ